MIRIVTARRLRATEEQAAAARDRANQTEVAAETARTQVAGLVERVAQLEGERDAVKARPLLDHEDQVALRALLRQARRQARTPRVHVLYHRGRLHSIHATAEAAEEAAEAEGAPRSGWAQWDPGAPLRPAAEVLWRIVPMPLGGAR